MEYLAQEIIREFERKSPIPVNIDDWEENAEEILLYLSAKKYLEKIKNIK